jgi:hypothetical protein
MMCVLNLLVALFESDLLAVHRRTPRAPHYPEGVLIGRTYSVFKRLERPWLQ